MILDRCVLDAQRARDLLIAKPLRYQRGDLVLARRERVRIAVGGSFRTCGCDPAEQQRGDARRTNELVAHGAVGRRHHIFNRAIARHEARHAGFGTGTNLLLDVGNRDSHDLQLGQDLTKRERHLEPGWRSDVEQHHIGTRNGDLRR
jgi:hypothetical protein